MSHAIKNDIGGFIRPVSVLPPIGSGARTRTGDAALIIDRLGFQSAVLVSDAGAVTGGPSAQTLNLKLQDSDDGSTGWADLPGAEFAEKTTATAALRRLNLNLAGAKRYVRAVEVVTLTGGTSPTSPHSATLILGGAENLPVA